LDENKEQGRIKGKMSNKKGKTKRSLRINNKKIQILNVDLKDRRKIKSILERMSDVSSVEFVENEDFEIEEEKEDSNSSENVEDKKVNIFKKRRFIKNKTHKLKDVRRRFNNDKLKIKRIKVEGINSDKEEIKMFTEKKIDKHSSNSKKVEKLDFSKIKSRKGGKKYSESVKDIHFRNNIKYKEGRFLKNSKIFQQFRGKKNMSKWE